MNAPVLPSTRARPWLHRDRGRGHQQLPLPCGLDPRTPRDESPFDSSQPSYLSEPTRTLIAWRQN